MCECHINDVIRKIPGVKKVKSSHLKNESVVISLDHIDEDVFKKAIEGQGYYYLGYQEEEYKKKGLFDFLKK